MITNERHKNIDDMLCVRLRFCLYCGRAKLPGLTFPLTYNLVISAAPPPSPTRATPALKKSSSFTPTESAATIALFFFPFHIRLLSPARSYASVSFKRPFSQRAIRRGRGCRGDRSRLWTREHQIKVSSPALPPSPPPPSPTYSPPPVAHPGCGR